MTTAQEFLLSQVIALLTERPGLEAHEIASAVNSRIREIDEILALPGRFEKPPYQFGWCVAVKSLSVPTRPPIKLTLPTVHLNGTPKARLLDEQCFIMAKLCEAREEILTHGPNARDYYPQGDDAYDKARSLHVEQLKKLDDMIKHYETIAEHIADS